MAVKAWASALPFNPRLLLESVQGALPGHSYLPHLGHGTGWQEVVCQTGLHRGRESGDSGTWWEPGRGAHTAHTLTRVHTNASVWCRH